jgi:hypothetical protein
MNTSSAAHSAFEDSINLFVTVCMQAAVLTTMPLRFSISLVRTITSVYISVNEQCAINSQYSITGEGAVSEKEASAQEVSALLWLRRNSMRPVQSYWLPGLRDEVYLH